MRTSSRPNPFPTTDPPKPAAGQDSDQVALAASALCRSLDEILGSKPRPALRPTLMTRSAAPRPGRIQQAAARGRTPALACLGLLSSVLLVAAGGRMI